MQQRYAVQIPSGDEWITAGYVRFVESRNGWKYTPHNSAQSSSRKFWGSPEEAVFPRFKGIAVKLIPA